VAESGVISKALAGKLGDGMGQVVLDAGLAGAKTFATSTISSAVSGITYSDSEGFGYSSEAFTSSFKAGLVSSAVSMTSTFATGALGQVNLFNGTGDTLRGDVFNTQDIQKFNKMAGGLVGQGVNYALGGDFTVNVLNLSMLGIDIKGERLESGLFEVRFGRDGVSTAIGTGGVDMSYGALIAGIGGLSSTARIGGSKVAALFGNYRGISTIDAINYLGGTGKANNELARNVWTGKVKAKYKDLGTDEEGNERLGLFDPEKGNEILLSKSLLGNKDKGLSAKRAAVMAHEGTHLNGNDYEGIAHLQGNSTYNAINEMFSLEEDGEFSGKIISEILNHKNWTKNTGDVDNWILMRDGTLVKDKDGWLRDENGMYINEDGSRSWQVTDKTIGAKGIETGLLNILYGGTSNVDYTNFSDSQIEKVHALLTNSGFIHSEGAMRDVSWKEGNDGAYIPFANIVNEGFGASVADDVFMNGYDELTNTMLFDAMSNSLNTDWMYDSNAGTILFGGGSAGMPYGFGFMLGGGNLQNAPDYVAGRLTDYFNEKLNFYDELRQVFLPGQLNSLHMTGLFGKDKYYTDDQHKGIDIGKDDPNMDVNIYSLFSGKVK
jgi:hypothetical protein